MLVVEVDCPLDRALNQASEVRFLRPRPKSVGLGLPGADVGVGNGVNDGDLFRQILVKWPD
jgi:hypothetical protein